MHTSPPKLGLECRSSSPGWWLGAGLSQAGLWRMASLTGLEGRGRGQAVPFPKASEKGERPLLGPTWKIGAIRAESREGRRPMWWGTAITAK